MTVISDKEAGGVVKRRALMIVQQIKGKAMLTRLRMVPRYRWSGGNHF